MARSRDPCSSCCAAQDARSSSLPRAVVCPRWRRSTRRPMAARAGVFGPERPTVLTPLPTRSTSAKIPAQTKAPPTRRVRKLDRPAREAKQDPVRESVEAEAETPDARAEDQAVRAAGEAAAGDPAARVAAPARVESAWAGAAAPCKTRASTAVRRATRDVPQPEERARARLASSTARRTTRARRSSNVPTEWPATSDAAAPFLAEGESIA